MKRNSKSPVKTAEAEIVSLTHDGRGIAHLNGKTTFIENALPGEKVKFEYTHFHGKYDEGRAIEWENLSPDRITPRCPHFGVCGGCAMQHITPEGQRRLKEKTLIENLQHFGKVQAREILPPLVGNDWGYRQKARLGAKYVTKKNGVLVGFREKNGRYLADLHECPVLHPSVGEHIDTLREVIQSLNAAHHIPQIEVAVSDNTTALVIRHLVPLTGDDKEKLIQMAQRLHYFIYLQSAGPDSIIPLYPEKPEALHYTLADDNVVLSFQPTDFTQINANINRQMVKRAIELLELNANDVVLDLFCGLGNFTLPLARHCQKIIGIEGDAKLVERARHNAENNQITNAEFFAADLTLPLEKNIFAKIPFNKILLDPPRTGALEIVKQFPQFNVERIVYVSCNPATLARDVSELIEQGYQLEKAGIMDMFPHTHHVEAIALLTKKIKVKIG